MKLNYFLLFLNSITKYLFLLFLINHLKNIFIKLVIKTSMLLLSSFYVFNSTCFTKSLNYFYDFNETMKKFPSSSETSSFELKLKDGYFSIIYNITTIKDVIV